MQNKTSIKCLANITKNFVGNSRIRETSNLSTDADRRTDRILERLHDLSKKKLKKILKKIY